MNFCAFLWGLLQTSDVYVFFFQLSSPLSKGSLNVQSRDLVR